MAALTHKLMRDIRANAGSLALVVAIIGVGTGSFVALGTAQRILESSQQSYYRDYRFADFWIDVKKAPLSAVDRIANMPGVADVEARVTFDVILDLPNVVQPLSGRLISTPTYDFAETINGIHLVRGSGFSDDRNEEIILSEQFAAKHNLDPGDRIQLILNRKQESFIIVGTAISPEYVYMVRGEGDFMPDPEHFGVLYIKERYAREVLDFQDACNEIVGRLVPGSDADVESLLSQMSRALDDYGVLATTPRSRQASNRFLSDEIEGLASTAAIMPGIFLAVAALVLNLLMSRMAERQRTIIGTLKALGYSNGSVMRHFLSYGLAVGAAGTIAGWAAGILLAWQMIEMYKMFYAFPAFLFQMYPDLLLTGMFISVGFALGGTAKGVWAVLRLEPAEAMRTRPPERGGAILLERFPWLWRQFGFRTHIALRAVFRNRFRTATGVFSSALAAAIILLTLALYDSINHLVDVQFKRIVRSDADIGMRDERSTDALFEVLSLPAVDRAEPLLGVTCDVQHGRFSRRLSISGLSADHTLTMPMNADGSPIEIPRRGLVLSSMLSRILDARVGDRLEVTPVRGRRDAVAAYVASVAEDYVGLSCYADLRYLSEIVGESAAINAVQVAIDPTQRNALYREIKTLPNAQGLSVMSDAVNNIESTFVETMSFSLGLMIVFAGVIAMGSTLNTSLIEIGDRLRDIATFRVLGYRPAQIAAIFFRQNLIVFVIGLVLALPIGYALVYLSAQAYESELFRMPVIISARSILLTCASAFVFVALAQCFVYRQIARLDWVEGMKVKE